MFGNRYVKVLTVMLVLMLVVSLAPTIQAQDGSSITIVIGEDPPSFNPAGAETGFDMLVMEMVLLGMADIDPTGNVYPELAVELPTAENGGVVVDEDEWTMDVTWTMRDDVFWADGEPVTADDVIFTWDAIADPELGVWVPGLDYTDSVEKVDDYSFVVHYNTVYPAYLTHFGGEPMAIWPEHYCDASQGVTAWDCGREPLSNGPYILEEWVVGDHLSFVRNPTYFEEGKPNIDQVIVLIVPDESVRKTMLLEGDADAEMWVTELILQEVADDDRVNISIAPTDRWVMRIFPNLAARGSTDPVENPHPILSDVNVRQAIRMAIDIDIIAEEIFYGYARPVWTELFRPPYVCDVARPTYDPEGAAALLEAAGWTDEDGDGVRECHGCTTGAEDGYRMSMEFAIYDYGESLDLTQQLIAEMLGVIGIELELVMVEGTIMWATSEEGGTEQTGNFDLNMWDDGYPGIDPSDHLWAYYYIDAATPDFGWNIARYLNEELSELIDATYDIDEAARTELFCQIADVLDQDLPQIPLFSVIDAAMYSPRLSGVQATINDILTWNIADWEVSE